MEKKFQLTNNGQQLQQQDLNLLGETSGLADDRVFAELFRMTPYNGSSATKGILPYGHKTAGATALVAPNGASGSVLVNPFRAFISSRTAVGTNAKDNWRDIRSTIAVGTTTLAQTVAITANSSGNPRWDLVYAVVSVDANSASTTRKVKDPVTKDIIGTTVVTTKETKVDLGILAGTPAASPAWPAITADSGSNYYVPIAYIRVPNGFGATSTVGKADIAEIAPVLHISRATGANNVQVADQHYTAGGSVMTTARIGSWGSSGVRPGYFLPPTVSGGTSLFVVLNMKTGSLSHNNLDVVDSRDWRGRFCKFFAATCDSSAHALVTDSSAGTIGEPHLQSSSSNEPMFAPSTDVGGVSNCMVGLGSTVINDTTSCVVAYVSGNALANMANGTSVVLFCDFADSGKLKVSITGAPNCYVFLWLDFTGPFPNSF